MPYGDGGLLTISPEGKVPETRMKNAVDCQSFVRRLIDDDQSRSKKRALVNGLVDGNPPYKQAKLAEAGRAEACNVNWGRARSYMESGSGSFYDLFSEAPGFVTIRTDYGTPEQKEIWSAIISEEADRALRACPEWDYNMSLSLDNMVLHGTGPLMFEDTQSILPKAFLAGDLKVPEFTKSESKYWDACAVQATYYPPELYEFIQNKDAAESVGWNVEYTKRVIANAMDIRNQAGIQYEWEFYQQELKNNTLSYYNNSKICRIAHVYWKEFDGRVTHAIVERDMASGTPTEKDAPQPDYMFISVGRYKNFNEAIHAMYFDHGNGGYHHSVTGLGVKMYSAMNYENRLLCNLSDKAFSPKTLVRPTTSSASQKLQLARIGDYEVLPAGVEFQQTPIMGMIQEGSVVYELISGINSNVLSTYRQPVMQQKQGNPVTKFEKQFEASLMSAMSKTQFNRFYAQLDALYVEIYRRMTNLNTTDDRAKEFQDRCKKRGVPKEALARTDKIQATRVVGQGSAFMRKQAIDSLIPMAGALPEDGRDNLMRDKIAAEAGQSAVSRYYPRKAQPMPDDQQATAMLWVAAAKTGVPPVITSDQNPTIFAITFIQAAGQSLQSVQQGGNPLDVLRFLNTIGPAIAAHLQRLQGDPTRQELSNALSQQFKKIGMATDKLRKQVQQMGQQQQAQQQKTQNTLNDAQLKMLKLRSDVQLKQQKQNETMRQREQAHQLKLRQQLQDMALKDASTANDIHLSRMRSLEE